MTAARRAAPPIPSREGFPSTAERAEMFQQDAEGREGRPEQRTLEETRIDERALRVQRAFEVPMLVAALLVIPVLVLEESGAGEQWGAIAEVLNWMIWGAFAVEAAVMLAIVRQRR